MLCNFKNIRVPKHKGASTKPSQKRSSEASFQSCSGDFQAQLKENITRLDPELFWLRANIKKKKSVNDESFSSREYPENVLAILSM